MKKNAIENVRVYCMLVFAFLLLCLTSCATNKPYPYFITRVKPGKQNAWIREDISESGNTGTIYTQFIPLSANKTALLTVGKINKMLVAQIIIPIMPGSVGSSVSFSFIELDDNHFDANMNHPTPWSDSIYISIIDPKKFIKTLQQQKLFTSRIMFNMDVYRCMINGNLDIF